MRSQTQTFQTSHGFIRTICSLHGRCRLCSTHFRIFFWFSNMFIHFIRFPTTSYVFMNITVSYYFNLFQSISYIFSIFYFHYSSYMFIYTYSIIIILFHTVSNSSPLLCLPWHWALYLSQLPADLVHFWEENPQEWNVLNKWNWTKHNQTMSLQ